MADYLWRCIRVFNIRSRKRWWDQFDNLSLRHGNLSILPRLEVRAGATIGAEALSNPVELTFPLLDNELCGGLLALEVNVLQIAHSLVMAGALSIAIGEVDDFCGLVMPGVDSGYIQVARVDTDGDMAQLASKVAPRWAPSLWLRPAEVVQHLLQESTSLLRVFEVNVTEEARVTLDVLDDQLVLAAVCSVLVSHVLVAEGEEFKLRIIGVLKVDKLAYRVRLQVLSNAVVAHLLVSFLELIFLQHLFLFCF